jgi:hypothetical protein
MQQTQLAARHPRRPRRAQQGCRTQPQVCAGAQPPQAARPGPLLGPAAAAACRCLLGLRCAWRRSTAAQAALSASIAWRAARGPAAGSLRALPRCALQQQRPIDSVAIMESALVPLADPVCQLIGLGSDSSYHQCLAELAQQCMGPGASHQVVYPQAMCSSGAVAGASLCLLALPCWLLGTAANGSHSGRHHSGMQ